MSGMKLAIKVLDKLDKKELFKDEKYSIYPYNNCREKGFLIIRHYDYMDFDDHPVVCFSENRNSDSLFVITGVVKEFNWNENGVIKSEVLWETRKKYFNPDVILTEGIAYIKKAIQFGK